MKKLLFILVMLAIHILVKAQTSNLEWLNIGVVLPESHDLLTEAQLEKIHSKLSTALSQNGISSDCVCSNIVAYPKINLNNESNANTGMATLRVLDFDLSIFISDINGKVVFGSTTQRIRGSAKSKDQAITNALNSIDPNAAAFTKFIDQAKTKISDYYSSNCTKIIDNASQLAKTGRASEGLMDLMNIPINVPCYDKAKKISIDIFKQYINEQCTNLLHKAKSAITMRNYSEALDLISQIDPSTKCYPEVKKVMDAVSKEVKEEDLRRWQFLQKVYESEVDLEKTRINAIRDIGVAFGRGRDVNVINVFR